MCFIRNFSEPEQWYYVPSELNPADIASRGCSVEQLKCLDLWNKGPSFLCSNSVPDQLYEHEVFTDLEVREETYAHLLQTRDLYPTDVLIESASSWYKLLVKVSWIVKFKVFLKSGMRNIYPI